MQACSRSYCVLVPVDTWLTTLYILLGVSLLLPAAAALAYYYAKGNPRCTVHSARAAPEAERPLIAT